VPAFVCTLDSLQALYNFDVFVSTTIEVPVRVCVCVQEPVQAPAANNMVLMYLVIQ